MVFAIQCSTLFIAGRDFIFLICDGSKVNLGRNKYICFEFFETCSLNFSLKEEAMKSIHKCS